MSNRVFFNQLEAYQSRQLVYCAPKKQVQDGFIRISIGKRSLFVHNSLTSFIETVCNKIDEEQLFSQDLIEKYYNRTHSFISGLAKKGEVAIFSSNGIKLYIMKDW